MMELANSKSMSTITAIKSQRNQKRVNIYLDGKFEFGLDLENYVRLGLKVGQELSEERIIEITKKAEFQKVLDRLLFFTTLRPRSGKEVHDWMIRKKVNEDFKKTLIDKITKLDLLDDEKFAQWWVEQRQNFRPKPKRILNQELRIKGVGKDIILKVLSETEVDEVGEAKKTIEKNAYKWSKFPERIAKQKIGLYLAGKGFGWDVIKKVNR